MPPTAPTPAALEFLRPYGRMLKEWSFDMEKDDFTMDSSLAGYWYLSPEQHIAETVVFNIIYIFFFYLSTLRSPKVFFKGQDTKWKFDIWDNIFRWSFVASFAYIAYCKWHTNRFWFMLMPCHVLTTMLLIMFFTREEWTTKLFNIYVHYAFMPVLAVVFPDTRDYTMPFEAVDYFVQHGFMILAPLYFLWRGRFSLQSGGFLLLQAYFYGGVYFVDVLAPISFYKGFNLNFMLVPPLGPLEHFGIYYRLVQQGFCIVMAWTFHYLHTYIIGILIFRLKNQEGASGKKKKQ